MYKNILIVVGITILFLGTCITSSVAIDNVKKSSMPISNGNILYVGGTGEGNYTKIQDAIDNASDGNIIFVFNGNYTGFKATKRLDIIGESRDYTIINIGSASERIRLKANWTNFSNFKVTGGIIGLEPLVQAEGNNVTISNLNLYTTKSIYGIEVGGTYSSTEDYYREHITVSNCVIKGCSWIGINMLYSHHCTVENCTLYKNDQGILIMLSGYYHSSYHIIKNCEFYNNDDGIWIERHRNTIDNCDFYDNINGIHIYAAKNNYVTNSTFRHNTLGGYIRSYYSSYGKKVSKENRFISNTFMTNNQGISFKLYCKDNYVYLNNFVNNEEFNAEGIGADFWDNGNKGNFWDDYNGNDNNHDGIGDTPYYISGNNIDNYPLMNTTKNLPPSKPIKPDGPITGKKVVEYKYTSSSFDVDDDQIYYLFNWGDGSYTGWIGPYESNEEVTVSHKWLVSSNYEVSVLAKDSKGQLSLWSESLAVGISIPSAPKITGPTIVKPGETCEYTFVSTDPDEDELYYYVYWCGGDYTEWTGPYASGEEVKLTYTWDESLPIWDFYYIKAKVRDTDEVESDQGELLVLISRTRANFNPLFYWFLERFPLLEKLLSLLL